MSELDEKKDLENIIDEIVEHMDANESKEIRRAKVVAVLQRLEEEGYEVVRQQ